jgi:uncharacterized protein YhbP (UPF0306 family)
MNMHELRSTYLEENSFMQLATSRGGQPWICTVSFVADDAGSVYWMSGRATRHSLEILDNANAAITIVHSTEPKQAMQAAGTAAEVADGDLERVHALYTAKFGPRNFDLEAMKQRNPQGISYWVFKPTDISFWDEVAFPQAPKQAYQA